MKEFSPIVTSWSESRLQLDRKASTPVKAVPATAAAPPRTTQQKTSAARRRPARSLCGPGPPRRSSARSSLPWLAINHLDVVRARPAQPLVDPEAQLPGGARRGRLVGGPDLDREHGPGLTAL